MIAEPADTEFSVIGHPDNSEGISYVDVDFDHAVRGAVATRLESRRPSRGPSTTAAP